MIESKPKIVGITKKGQATIPADLRRKHKLGKKALVVDTKKGILIKSVPDPRSEIGSLKGLFDRDAKRLLEDSRRADRAKEESLEGRL